MNEREQRALDALVSRATRFVVADESGRVTTRSNSVESLASLRAALRLRLDGARRFCMCNGSEYVVLFAGRKRIGDLSNQHGTSVRFSGAESDLRLADGGAAWCHWLAQHGAPQAHAMWVRGQRALAAQAVERWRGLLPQPVRSFWEVVFEGGPMAEVSVIAETLASAVPEPHERARQLLAWYGAGSDNWAAPPAYEHLAEALLAAQAPEVLAATVEFSPDQNVLTGAARFFSSDAFPERTVLSPFLKARLLRFTRLHHPAHLLRATTAFGEPQRTPQPQTLEALLAKVTRFEVETGGRVTARRSSKEALEGLGAAARVTESNLNRCVCDGDARVRLFAGQTPLGTLSTIHAHVLRFPGGVGDALLVDDGAPWRAWLAEHGVHPKAHHPRDPDELEAGAERWLGSIPPPLRGLWGPLLEGSRVGRGVPSLRTMNAALAAGTPARTERIRQLFAWFGSCSGSWTHFAAYERQIEALLLGFDTRELAAVVEASDASRIHEGAARFFSGEAFERRRARELKHLSPVVRAKLLNCLRRTRNVEHLARVEQRLGPAAFDPERALEALSQKRSRDFTPEQIHFVVAGLEGFTTSWPAVFVREAIRLAGNTRLQTRWRAALAMLEKMGTNTATLSIRPAWKLAAMQAATVAGEPPGPALVALARDASEASRDALLAEFERASALDSPGRFQRVLKLRRCGQGVAQCETLFWKYVERYGPEVALWPREQEQGLAPQFSFERR